ncbi:MAG TPA: hypothetical protein VKB50_29155 [Vicinamibacterales bacterium]|nr:hypothetical protein [Vicinamibacterales bacterium]
MRILFSTSSFGFLRNFQSTVRLLAERGHHVHLLAERGDTVDGQIMADALAAEHPTLVTWGLLPSTRHRLWYGLGTGLRASLDYWRYLDSRWDDAPKLRERAASLAPAFARVLPRIPPFGTRAGLALLQQLFRAVDRALPPPPEIAELFSSVKPDLLLLTPLLYFRSHQVDHVRCARQLGLKSIVGIGSWDHLTTKGLIHEAPDRVLVWNEAQKQEAVELHGVPPERVVVTGSQAYDHWFAMTPSLGRAAFCARAGLDPSRPVILYLCSSIFIAPHEVGFVRSWMAAIRGASDPWLRSAGLLVRPHPQNSEQWRGVDLGAEFDNVALWPKVGVNPIGAGARHDYFDSMYFAEAVVGVNTSGMIESGIIGRPVFAVQVPEFQSTQDGTLHFQHLKNVEGGLLYVSGDLATHVAQLTAVRADRESSARKLRGFVQAFVRPHGLDVVATPRLVDEIERYVAGPPVTPAAPSLSARAVRVVLAPVAMIFTLWMLEPAKRRAVILHWIRPARLMMRGVISRAVYGARVVRRMPRRVLSFAWAGIRLLMIRPARWTLHRAKRAIGSMLASRSDEPDEAA